LPGLPSEPIGLSGGDLARTMGGGAPGRFDGVVTRAPVDLLRVRLDGTETFALSHVVLRDAFWRRRVVLLMNAQFLSRRDVAPRSHPNDGRVDVLEVAADMPLRARLQAARRSVTGTHLPHPQLSARQVQRWSMEFDRPIGCWLDGERAGRVSRFELEVVPDGLVVHV
ncbi:MAG: hypothetical protein ACKPDI_01795, partial [Actinomycetota bacterium]